MVCKYFLLFCKLLLSCFFFFFFYFLDGVLKAQKYLNFDDVQILLLGLLVSRLRRLRLIQGHKGFTHVFFFT